MSKDPETISDSKGKHSSRPPDYSLHSEASSSSGTQHLLPRHVSNPSLTSYPPQTPQGSYPFTSSSQATITSQPPRKVNMNLKEIKGSRNGRQMPVDLREKRDWSSRLFGCSTGGDTETDTCCMACFCPCIVYGRNKTRLDHLSNHGLPEPEGGTTGGECAAHALVTSLFCMAGCAMQAPLRSTIRDRYSIRGSGAGDLCTSICCYPCALTQEHIEISAEENSFPRGVGGSTGVYYGG
ncbi:hypothetical protein D9757_008591 [Collybiopsis confluens]|uniref:PLAC8-domain-containing protein n=1 Tax=Collybiopsis confluens TaxID=2823264 RepID=A0A8H5M9X4_9AGAR|nr:hypothetical protein D9757_008591 [Collybiopsis confluens]